MRSDSVKYAAARGRWNVLNYITANTLAHERGDAQSQGQGHEGGCCSRFAVLGQKRANPHTPEGSIARC